MPDFSPSRERDTHTISHGHLSLLAFGHSIQVPYVEILNTSLAWLAR